MHLVREGKLLVIVDGLDELLTQVHRWDVLEACEA
jgi:hypothetical protein